MSLMFIRTHDNDGLKTTKVTDIMSGEVLVFTSNDSNYEKKLEIAINAVDNSEDFATLKDSFEKSTGNAMKDIRDQLGIVLEDNGDFTVEGFRFPAAIAPVFDNMVDVEHGERLIKFAKDLARNPYSHAVEALIEWISHNPSLRILEDGRIMGYRGLTRNMESINSGYGIINGVEVNGRHDNTPGNIIEFPVSMTDHNSLHLCSIGVHVGTLDYASDFGVRVVTVAFSAADVISPPADAKQSKIRVSKFEVLKEITKTIRKGGANV